MSERVQPPTIDLGSIRVRMLDGGSLRLDGGAMFGIIPKALWNRRTDCDDQNRILLACNCLLVEWPDQPQRRAIIETGHGPKYDAKECDMFAIDPARWLLPTLRGAGIAPETVTDVAVTHLHFDHAGGLTRPEGNRVVPTFPNARVHVTRREFEDARENFGIMTATYRPENLDPLSAADAWNLVEGETEFLPGVRSFPTPGHTRGHQSVLIAGKSRTLVFAGDVMPTAAHVGAAWNMAYDLFPLQNRESKRRLLEQAARHGWLLVLGHEPHAPLLRVQPDRHWFRLEPVSPHN